MAGEDIPPSIDERLRRLGIVLPPRRPPTGSYAHSKVAGGLLYLAGQDPEFPDGSIGRGRLGRDLTVEEGYRHARQVGLTLIAAMKEALGELERVRSVVKILAMVNATPDFAAHARVADGCSELFVEVFGERGRCARSVIGMSSLPDGIPVEIEAIVAIE